MWYTLMFYNLAIVSVGRLFFMLPLLSERVDTIVQRVFYTLFWISFITTNIIGLVWRYGEAGRFASEIHDDVETDELLQLKSARFINIYYVFGGISIALAFIMIVATLVWRKIRK